MSLLKMYQQKKDVDDKYYISITVQCLDTKNNSETKGNKKEIFGIDMSMRCFLVSSEGQKIKYPKYLLKNENKLKKYQKNYRESKKVILIELNLD